MLLEKSNVLGVIWQRLLQRHACGVAVPPDAGLATLQRSDKCSACVRQIPPHVVKTFDVSRRPTGSAAPFLSSGQAEPSPPTQKDCLVLQENHHSTEVHRAPQRPPMLPPMLPPKAAPPDRTVKSLGDITNYPGVGSYDMLRVLGVLVPLTIWAACEGFLQRR